MSPKCIHNVSPKKEQRIPMLLDTSYLEDWCGVVCCNGVERYNGAAGVRVG